MRWELQAHGLHWDRVVLDGGAAMQAACDAVTPEVLLQGDSWHERFDCGKVQARLQRARTQLEQRTPAARRAALPPVNSQRATMRRPMWSRMPRTLPQRAGSPRARVT